MKKGSLNLSIEVIVVVVIAFVVLGLGLGFVRTQFEDIKQTTSTIQEQIKQQVLDDLRTGNKKLSFPATQIRMGVNEQGVHAVGIRNVGDQTLKFKLTFEVKIGGENFGTFTPGTSRGSDEAIAPSARVDWDDSKQELVAGESRVYPITIVAPSKAENYLYRVSVIEVTDTGTPIPNKSLYDSRTFFVKTS